MSILRSNSMAVIVAAVSLTAAPAVYSQENEYGKQLFETSCAICHGSGGLGDGEFGNYLTVKPANLTVLAKNNDGQFPYLKVFHIVDGRSGVRAHGAGAMPIWGDVFTREIGETGSPFGSEVRIRAKIVSLVDYLETLQE